MALNSRKCLKDILVGRNKGLSSKEAPKTQLPPISPSPSSFSARPTPQSKLAKEEKERGGHLGEGDCPTKGLETVENNQR